MYEREKSRSAKKSAKNLGARKKSAKNQGARERESANAKARNLRPNKERESASAKSSAKERESASTKRKKSACLALLNSQDLPSFRWHCFFSILLLTHQVHNVNQFFTFKTLFLLLPRPLQIILSCCPAQSSERSVRGKQSPWQLRPLPSHPPFIPLLGLVPCGFCSSCLSQPPQWLWQQARNKQSTIDRPILFTGV
jgi:hypothetical protein